MGQFSKLKNEVYNVNMRLPQLGLVLFTFGNASAVDRERGIFAIKPSGVPYADLTPEKMVVVDFEGTVVEGILRPSSDTKTHAVLYKYLEDIGGIVHTHSTYATAWAQAGRDIPIMGTTHADHLTTDIPCAPPMDDESIKGNYEYETGFQILKELENRNLDYKEVEMMILGNHGPFSWGKSIDKAVYNSAILEECAKLAYLSLSINPSAPRLKNTLIQKHFERKHGPDSYYGQDNLTL